MVDAFILPKFRIKKGAPTAVGALYSFNSELSVFWSPPAVAVAPPAAALVIAVRPLLEMIRINVINRNKHTATF